MNKITHDSDAIILYSVESYLKAQNYNLNAMTPQERLVAIDGAKRVLYTDIVQRFPRVAYYILHSDMESDTNAQGMDASLRRHAMNPEFIKLLLEYLDYKKDPYENSISGAYLARILNKWLEQNIKTPEKIMAPPKEGETEGFVEDVNKPKQQDLEPVSHIKRAVDILLGNLQGLVLARCNNITSNQALAIAACLAMNSGETLREIIASDLPITADVLELVGNQCITNFVKAALLFEKNDIPAKLSTNQTAFVDSLKRWVYKILNMQSTQEIYQFLVAVYGTANSVDVSTQFINPKDCGTQYSNLLTVAKQLINK